MHAKHKLVSRFISITVLAWIIAACSSPTESVASLQMRVTTEVITEIPGVTIEQPVIRVNITATNTTGRSRSFRLVRPCSEARSVALYVDSTYMDPPVATNAVSGACSLVLEPPVTIGPNETRTFAAYVLPPAPGKYYVRVFFGIDNEEKSFDAGAVTIP